MDWKPIHGQGGGFERATEYFADCLFKSNFGILDVTARIRRIGRVLWEGEARALDLALGDGAVRAMARRWYSSIGIRMK